MRPPVNGAGNKFLARPGFSGDQNGGVCGSNLGYTRKHRLQGGRRSDDLLEHRCLIDFFTQSDVLMLESLFSLLAILDIGRRGIPTCEAPLFIQNRIKAEKKPAILPVSPPSPRFELVRGSASEFARTFARHSWRILRVEQAVQTSAPQL